MIRQMVRCVISSVSLGVALVAALAVAEEAANEPAKKDAPTACMTAHGNLRVECAFYPKVPQPEIYASASGDERYVDPRGRDTRRDDFLNHMAADAEDLASGKPRVRLHSLWRPLAAWIDRDEIVRYSDLRRVTACWPIVRTVMGLGDAPPATIKFKRNGTGVLRVDGRVERVQAWYFEGVYSVRADDGITTAGRLHDYVWGNLDVSKRSARDRVPEVDHSLRSTEELGPGCENGPVTGPSTTSTSAPSTQR